jgi:hypothetical protein
MDKKKIFCGVRLSREEVGFLELTGKKFRQTKTEVIRCLIKESMEGQKNPSEQVKEEIQELRQTLQGIFELNRYVASLITALVRKSSKSDPMEGEKIITKAREEAKIKIK